MDGIFHKSNLAGSHVQLIQAWMVTNVQNRGYERDDELHIDRIDPAWKPREKWIDAGIEVFLIAADLRDRDQLSFTVALAFSLISQKPIAGTGIRTREELESQLDGAPPSLYLFARGDEPWNQTRIRKADAIADNIVVKELPPELLGRVISEHLYYLEFRQVKYDEWSRSIFLEG